ncbi:winged helix-turn-helix domain-containing protein [Nakamurella lactea]|uniref:winged helix-turn-helix domain-containing protein n=1 Tax=Nakamurella lactea TaxID=459515 RepID=UPI000414C52D|nr:winged helix-turn-helix domain-containing protein [Nakamurella lactea]
MTLRLIFDREDLERVRVAPGADPMWELVLGLNRARARQVAPQFRPWREAIRQRGRPSQDLGRSLAMLGELIPPTGSFPDTLTPAPSVTELDAGCGAIAAVGRPRLSADLESVYRSRPAPQWVKQLADGDRGRRGDLVAAVRRVHDWLIGPFREWTDEAVAADRAVRRQQVGDLGVGHLLANLPGIISWDGEVLTIAYPVQRTIRLGGRGITLLPSYFCWGRPVTLIDPELPPILVYPAAPTPAAPAADFPADPPPKLVALFGRTRAQSLQALVRPRTTSGIARFVGSSVSAASKQMTVLRDAGLVASSRDGSAVVHRLTGLGRALLRDIDVTDRECFPQWAKVSC